MVRQTRTHQKHKKDYKAECDLPSVASIIGYPGTIKMLKNPEKYDLFERKKSRSVNDYFDKLFFNDMCKGMREE